jgi:hypothetical protein
VPSTIVITVNILINVVTSLRGHSCPSHIPGNPAIASRTNALCHALAAQSSPQPLSCLPNGPANHPIRYALPNAAFSHRYYVAQETRQNVKELSHTFNPLACSYRSIS